MSDFQKSFSESTSSIKFDEKYIDTSVQPNDIGVAEKWAVKTVFYTITKKKSTQYFIKILKELECLIFFRAIQKIN